MAEAAQFELLGLNLQELTQLVEKLGQASYRARQVFEAIYRQRVPKLTDITTLPHAFRSQLVSEGFEVSRAGIEKQFQSSDGTIRYLISFSDSQSVETVWMPEGDGGESGDGSEAGEPDKEAGRNWNRATVCVSSQVGCAVDCKFCLTAMLGVRRNLTAGEIVAQITTVLNDRAVDLDRDRINLVFMGQGEPFLNYDNFIKSVRLLADGVGISAQRMTVSTAGIVPRISDFGREAVRPKLAISLNGSNNEIRSAIMPINRKWDLSKVMAAAGDFPLRDRERLTFEYVLLQGVNDSADKAREVAGLLHGMRAKVNLIALNPGPDIPFSTPSEERVRTFQKVLTEAGIPTFVRRPRGRDIYAACGQLKRTVA